MSQSIFFQRIQSSLRTSCCRQQVSSNSMIWCCRTSTGPSRAQTQAAEPLGSSLSNMEMFRRIAEACGLSEAALLESDDALIGQLLRQTNIGMNFAELSEKGPFLAGQYRYAFGDGKFQRRREKSNLPEQPSSTQVCLKRRCRTSMPPRQKMSGVLYSQTDWTADGIYQSDRGRGSRPARG